MILKAMWPIKGRHRHLDAETLSAYLDGRVKGPAQARLERSLAECGVCREELASLRATVALVRQLPLEAPGRSFVMAAPPRQPAHPRPSPLARASMWAYAGAASLAAILLTVLVSADATGVLAPGQPTGTGDSAVVLDTAEESAESAPAEAADVLVMAEPTAAAEPAAIVDDMEAMADSAPAEAADTLATTEPTAAMESAEAFDEPEAMAADDSAAEPADTLDDSDAMADADSAPEPADTLDDSDAMADAGFAAEPADTLDDSDAMADADSGDQVRSQTPDEPEPTLETAPETALEEPVPTAVSQVGPTDANATASPDDAAGTAEPPSAALPETPVAPTPVEQASPPPAAATEQAAAQAPLKAPTQGAEIEAQQALTEAEPKQAPIPPAKGTAVHWRILEGLAAALVLFSLVALGFKWRASRARRTTLG